MSLTLYTAFPFTPNNKCRIRNVLTRSDLSSGNDSRERRTRTAIWKSSTSIATTPSTKLINRGNSTSSHVTKVASSVVAPTHEAVLLELEKKRNRGFWFREWNAEDLTNLGLVIGRHVLAVCALFSPDWGAIWLTAVLTLLSGIGVTLCYHRLLSHRSFKIPKWLEYFFAYCGVHAGLRDPIYWVSVHKNHHKYSDTERDPHSPREGFWFSHLGWFHYNEYLATKCGESRSGEYSNVPELKAQWFYRFLHNTYIWHTFALGALLYLLGGFPYLAWGMGMRTTLVTHFNFIIGSVSHLWGKRPWNSQDTSTNNWWVAMITLGEGWHNNHHAFPSSARVGLEWWQFDLTWEVIKFLEMVGLATDVKLPTKADKKRMTLCLDNYKQMSLNEYVYM